MPASISIHIATLCLFFNWSPIGETSFLLEGTEIYAPLWARSVLIEGNTIFLLDREGRLLCFDGKRLKELARKGEGPGELTRPQGFFRDGNSILVLDRQRFHIFNLAGTFHETRRLPPGLGSMVEKVAGGWVGINGLGYGQANSPLSLVFFKNDFSEKSVINSWSSEKERNPTRPEIPPRGLFNPVEDRTVNWTGYSGQYAYTKLSGRNEVIITDIQAKKTIATIVPEAAQLPFDREWGEQFLADFNRRYKSDLKGDFPDTMPVIRKIWVTREDHLVICKWSARPSLGAEESYRKEDLLVYDKIGNPILNPSLFDLHFLRVAHLDATRVAVNVYNAALDEYSIVLGSREAFADIIAAYPYMAP